MFTIRFVKQAAERAIKTAAQAVLTVWVVGDQIANALEFDWQLGAGVAAGGAIVSILTSIVSEPFGEPGTPSLVDGTNA